MLLFRLDKERGAVLDEMSITADTSFKRCQPILKLNHYFYLNCQFGASTVFFTLDPASFQISALPAGYVVSHQVTQHLNSTRIESVLSIPETLSPFFAENALDQSGWHWIDPDAEHLLPSSKPSASSAQPNNLPSNASANQTIHSQSPSYAPSVKPVQTASPNLRSRTPTFQALQSSKPSINPSLSIFSRSPSAAAPNQQLRTTISPYKAKNTAAPSLDSTKKQTNRPTSFFTKHSGSGNGTYQGNSTDINSQDQSQENEWTLKIILVAVFVSTAVSFTLLYYYLKRLRSVKIDDDPLAKDQDRKVTPSTENIQSSRSFNKASDDSSSISHLFLESSDDLSDETDSIIDISY